MRCFAGLPGAAAPLWQETQRLMTLAWLMLGRGAFAAVAAGAAATAGGAVVGDAPALGAGVLAGTVAPAKLTVLWWQFPHGAAVTTWVADLPRATLPL